MWYSIVKEKQKAKQKQTTGFAERDPGEYPQARQFLKVKKDQDADE